MAEFHDLYRRYYADVFRFALFLSGNRAVAEDLASETFVRAWVARDRLQHGTVRAYLLTITRNLHRDQLRAARPTQELDERIPDTRPSIEVQVQHSFALDAVRARLRRVAKGDRRALLMYVVRGMSYDEIAHALGVSVAAVKSRIFRAREELLGDSQ